MVSYIAVPVRSTDVGFTMPCTINVVILNMMIKNYSRIMGIDLQPQDLLTRSSMRPIASNSDAKLILCNVCVGADACVFCARWFSSMASLVSVSESRVKGRLYRRPLLVRNRARALQIFSCCQNVFVGTMHFTASHALHQLYD